jgi:hypothetical protein
MKKKTLKGFHKTKHFLERQKQRGVSDQAVIKAITSGELQNIDFGHSFKYCQLIVTIDLANSTLITVHPGDPASKSIKLLSKDEAKKIKEMIAKHETNIKPSSDLSQDEFLQYVHDNSVKKLEKS